MTKKDWSFYFRTIGSVVLLFYVFQKVGWKEVGNQLFEVNPLFFTLYIFLGIFPILISSVKWFLLTKPHGITASLPKLFLFYLVGMFFNNILPTSIGGDVVRAYELGKLSGKKEEALASVFVERFTGFTALIMLTILAVGLERRFFGDQKVLIFLGLTILMYLALLLVILNRNLLLFFQRKNPIRAMEKFFWKLSHIQEAIHLYRNEKRLLLIAMGYSFLFYFFCILNVYVGCLTFDIHVSMSQLFLAVPLMLLIFTIPISIGGIGLHEWTYYFVLTMVGVPAAVSLSLGLVYRARSLGYGLIGGAIYPFIGR